MSSDDDATLLMAAFRKGVTSKAGAATQPKSTTSAAPSSSPLPSRRSLSRTSPAKKRTPIAVGNVLSSSSSDEHVTNAASPPKVQRLHHVRTSPVRNRSEYTYYEPQDEVDKIIQERTRRGGQITYKVTLVGGRTKEVSEATSSTLQLSEDATHG